MSPSVVRPSVIRLAVAGARRPQAEIQALKQLQEKVELRALCDLNETMWPVWKEQFSGARFHRAFDELLADDTVNAIIVATPLRMHAEQSVAALKAGKARAVGSPGLLHARAVLGPRRDRRKDEAQVHAR